MREIPDTEFEMKADLVLLAMGFISPMHSGLLSEVDVAKDGRGNVQADTDSYRKSVPKVFAAERHAARPVARRVGDPRGAPVRAGGGRFDGLFELPR